MVIDVLNLLSKEVPGSRDKFFDAWGYSPGEHNSKRPNHGQRSVHREPKFNQRKAAPCTRNIR